MMRARSIGRGGLIAAALVLAVTGCDNRDELVEVEPVIAAPVSQLAYTNGQLLPDILVTTQDACLRRGHSTSELTSFPVLHRDERDELTELLHAAEERELTSYRAQGSDPNPRIVRFVWLPSFHPAVIVRLTEDENRGWQLSASRITSTDGSKPVVEQTQRTLSPAERGRIVQILEEVRPLDNVAKTCLGPDIDGARWIVEGIDEGYYRYVDRTSSQTEPIRSLGLAALGLTGWQFEDIY